MIPDHKFRNYVKGTLGPSILIQQCTSGGIASGILTLMLDAGEWSNSHPGCITPSKGPPGWEDR
jgi:hypothetical protein